MDRPVAFLRKVWTLNAQPGCYFFLSVKSLKRGKWSDHSFKWPVDFVKVRKFIKRYQVDHHMYFCPLPFNDKRRRRECVVGSTLLWADLDEAKPESCVPIPQVAWESSPGRYSALWILNKFHTAIAVEEVNKNLTYNSGADPGGWDLTQVLRIPGCKNYKYKENPVSKILWFTDNKYPIKKIPDRVIALLNSEEIYKKYKNKIPTWCCREITRGKPKPGKRSEVIWRLENTLSEHGLNDNEIFTLIKGSAWNKFKGRPDEDQQLQRELKKISDKQGPLVKLFSDDDGVKPKSKKPVIKKPKLNFTDDDFIRMDDVAPEEVEWVWFPYIPKGKLVLIEGDPSVGKSWLSLILAKHLTRRIPFPGSKKKRGGKVMLLSAEDGLSDTLRVRMDALDVNVKKVYALKNYIKLDETGMEILESKVAKINPSFIILDPLVAYMGGSIDLHKANETREMMAGLAAIGERQKCSIICIRHLRKGSADKSLYRGIGSIDLTAAARSVLLVGRNPNDPDQIIICNIKNNLAPQGKPMAYRLDKSMSSKTPFRWEGHVNITPSEILQEAKVTSVPSETEEAMRFLAERLSDGPMKREHLIRAGEAAGVSKGVLADAQKDLEIKAFKKKDEIWWKLKKP